MAFDFSIFSKRNNDVKEWLKKEFSSLRTSQASPALLDGVMVSVYGQKNPLKHIATISALDAKTLNVIPWDRSLVKDIESAIASSNLGLSTAPADSSVRVIFPDLTSERRSALLKIMKDKLEEAKVSIRKEREKVLSDIESLVKSKEISEDEKFTLKDKVALLVKDMNTELEAMTTVKEKEITV